MCGTLIGTIWLHPPPVPSYSIYPPVQKPPPWSEQLKDLGSDLAEKSNCAARGWWQRGVKGVINTWRGRSRWGVWEAQQVEIWCWWSIWSAMTSVVNATMTGKRNRWGDQIQDILSLSNGWNFDDNGINNDLLWCLECLRQWYLYIRDISISKVDRSHFSVPFLFLYFCKLFEYLKDQQHMMKFVLVENNNLHNRCWCIFFRGYPHWLKAYCSTFSWTWVWQIETQGFVHSCRFWRHVHSRR